ncbi:WecB/TagA/CpsF family glycosyltransferase [Halopseudomonas sp.]|uniref:WecB/TagA/CpsF family glycosyltransferase n=1 Tax=Halopseudomonas sp. TaxID=2901191 RepID=UPI003002D2FF
MQNLKSKIGDKAPSEFHELTATFLNPYSYLHYRKEPEKFKEFDTIFFDGILLAKLASFLYRKPISRVSFDMTSMAPSVFEFALKHDKTLALIGAEPGVVEIAAEVFKNEYSKLRIKTTRHGYFKNEAEAAEYINDLNHLNPDIVVVGMGTPKQEEFISKLLSTGWRGAAFTCGGFFHQTASRGKSYYPPLIDKFNLRFLYRMYDEPKLIKRYFLSYPKSLILFITDTVKSR